MTEHKKTTIFSLPPEIRQDILKLVLAPGLQLHLYLRDGCPCVSQCLGAKLGEEDYDERVLPGDPNMKFGWLGRKIEWGRRLSSPWANHYMCEEVRDGKRFADHPDRPAWRPVDMLGLLACKQM